MAEKMIARARTYNPVVQGLKCISDWMLSSWQSMVSITTTTTTTTTTKGQELARQSARPGPLLELFGHVILAGVFFDHTGGGKLWDQRHHGPTDSLKPLPGDALRIALEEQGNNFRSQDLKEIRAIDAVLLLRPSRNASLRR
jgi:hypothetical protein